MQKDELRNHLCNRLIPFWKKLRDPEYGGYYGWMDSGLQVDKEAVKGCILNSRILWFFSNAAMCLEKNAVEYPDGTAFPRGTVHGNDAEKETGNGKPSAGGKDTSDMLREYADWAYRFLKERCLDRERGGVFWSVDYAGQPEDTTKHTYNQAFAVYALSSYYRAYHNQEALALAEELIRVIETECFDEHGYKEAQSREFCPAANDKLSENGVMADRTMNTLLHILEAYTEYLLACREMKQAEIGRTESGKGSEGPVSETAFQGSMELPQQKEEIGNQEQLVRKKLHWILNLIENHVYNPRLHRQEVFFNLDMESLIDLHSYGHDIEAAWLMDRCLDVLGEMELTERISPMLRSLEAEVYKSAYTNHSLANECERGTVDTKRVWWVQAEGVVGFYNAWQRTGEPRYREASEDIWQFIRKYLVDSREDGEWFWYTDQEGNPALEKPIVEPWKCPYHNGRMCMEIINRVSDRDVWK